MFVLTARLAVTGLDVSELFFLLELIDPLRADLALLLLLLLLFDNKFAEFIIAF